MRFACKACGQILTKDLYPTKKSNYLDRQLEGSGILDTLRYPIIGSFKKIANRWSPWFSGPKNFIVDRTDLMITYPQYESGMGCCDVSVIAVQCSCGVVVGDINYDCWQTDHGVFLDIRKVNFIHKTVATLNKTLDNVTS